MKKLENPSKNWHCPYPNTADWNFNFYKLIQDGKPIGNFEVNKAPTIAIVGAGVAGLLAARELIKAGCKKIHIYEASERIGGRTHSIKVKGQEKTTYELGAMRIPFFFETEEAEKEKKHNSVLGYLTEIFNIHYEAFPAPGSDECYTGIFINDGFGLSHEFPEPKIIKWKDKEEIKIYPEIDPTNSLDAWKKTKKKNLWLQSVISRWTKFASGFRDFSKRKYNSSEWKPFWEKIVEEYHYRDFRELVFMDDKITDFTKGKFGGLGLSNKSATVFFTVGAGDGGWGAFYDISSLYVIRVLLCGFGSKHKLIVGCDFNDEFNNPYKDEQIKDSLENLLETPNFLGVQSFAEGLFYLPIEGFEGKSMYDLLKDKDYKIRLFTQDPVQVIERQYDENQKIKIYSKNQCKKYDDVILTTPTWATQVNLNLKFNRHENFKQELPDKVFQSMKFSHWITSCKVFFPLKERFWDNDDFPQVLLTDTFIQDVYIYAATEEDPGVLIASYTWEDNSMKMLGFKDDKELAENCLRKLDSIFNDCKVTLPGSKEILVISNLVNRDSPVVVHWSKKPNYAGCSKLYRQNNEKENYELLNYNRKHSEESHLYFAGEAYSVEGGWIEPAARLALDAVIHLIKNSGGEFIKPEFDYNVYEKLTNTDYLSRCKSTRK